MTESQHKRFLEAHENETVHAIEKFDTCFKSVRSLEPQNHCPFEFRTYGVYRNPTDRDFAYY